MFIAIFEQSDPIFVGYFDTLCAAQEALHEYSACPGPDDAYVIDTNTGTTIPAAQPTSVTFGAPPTTLRVGGTVLQRHSPYDDAVLTITAVALPSQHFDPDDLVAVTTVGYLYAGEFTPAGRRGYTVSLHTPE